jgi:flavin-dependent dehydrogenase
MESGAYMKNDQYALIMSKGSGVPARDTYDVVVAGASFAGLIAAIEASAAGASVAVVDPIPIGEGQTSACATTLGALHALGAHEVVQQEHRELVVHLLPRGARTPRTLAYRLPYRWATFDYRALCRALAARGLKHGVDFVRARVTGGSATEVRTDRGTIGASIAIDAGGWRAPLAGSLDTRYVRRDQLSCGLEAEVPQPSASLASGLHFWAGRGTIWPGYAWAFPAGLSTRVGVLAFADAGPSSANVGSSRNLRTALDTFMDGPAAEWWSPDGDASWDVSRERFTVAPSRTLVRGAPMHLHGGFIPCAPRPPVVGGVVCVGDAAGHCFGLTAEGIRAALTFAARAGQIAGGVAVGRWNAADARAMYWRFATGRWPYFALMRLLQRVVAALPDAGLEAYARAAQPWPIFSFLMAQYRWAANPVPVLARPV